MSSTAVVLKQLADQGELSTPHGGLAVGILLFQDLAALPFLVLVDAWAARGEGGARTIMTRLTFALVALAAIGSLALPLFKSLLSWVVRLRSNELMLLGTLAIAFGTAFLTHRLGLSPPIGAFLAGMAIGETDLHHQIEDDIRPFRDVLIGLFFVTVGMEIDVFAVARAPQVALMLLAAFFAKGIFVTGLVRAFRWPTSVAVRTGACLMQGGEFGLLLVTVAVNQGVLANSVGHACLVATALSMGVAPLIVQKNERLGRLISDSPAPQHEGEADILHQSHSLENHVILLGCGRIGRLVAPVLEQARVPYIALEKDPDQFQHAKRRGHKVVLADGSRTRLLDAAGLKHARLLVITFDHRRPLERILHHARHANPAVSTLVSARDDLELGSIIRAGATVVYPENLAAGLALANQALVLCGLSQDQASEFIKNTRAALNPEFVVQGDI
jgi:CPA2 family monovalent cation:H+ antiporter-2